MCRCIRLSTRGRQTRVSSHETTYSDRHRVSQAQLTAATEVGESFKRSRGDVRRERKLMQKAAALEEEVVQLKGQVRSTSLSCCAPCGHKPMGRGSHTCA